MEDDNLNWETEKANPHVRRRNALFVPAVDGFEAEAKKPVQVFDAVELGGVEIYCYGDLMDSSWFWEPEEPPLGYITQDSMRVALEQAGGKPVLLRIHSSGGDMMTASAIRALLMSYPGAVTCQIDGLCASAATFIATAGARVQMQDSAYFMIHDPSTFTNGTVEDHRVTISMLKELKKGIVEAYMAKSTLEQSQLEKMMSDETWMSAQTALEYGFVDEIISQPASARAALMARGSLPVMNHALKGYREVPEGVKAMLKVAEEPATSVPEAPFDTEPDQGEIERERAVQALREKIKNLKKEKV